MTNKRYGVRERPALNLSALVSAVLNDAGRAAGLSAASWAITRCTKPVAGIPGSRGGELLATTVVTDTMCAGCGSAAALAEAWVAVFDLALYRSAGGRRQPIVAVYRGRFADLLVQLWRVDGA